MPITTDYLTATYTKQTYCWQLVDHYYIAKHHNTWVIFTVNEDGTEDDLCHVSTREMLSRMVQEFSRKESLSC